MALPYAIQQFPQPMAFPGVAPTGYFGMTQDEQALAAQLGNPATVSGVPTATDRAPVDPYGRSATFSYMSQLTGGAISEENDPSQWTPEEAAAQTDAALAKIATANPELAQQMAQAQGKSEGQDLPWWKDILAGAGEFLHATKLDVVFEVLGRSAKIVPEILHDWNKESPWKNIGDALSGNSVISWDDVLVDNFGMERSWLTATLGFVGDVATDPLTYATFGMGGIARGTTAKIASEAGLAAALKKGSLEVGEEAATRLAAAGVNVAENGAIDLSIMGKQVLGQIEKSGFLGEVLKQGGTQEDAIAKAIFSLTDAGKGLAEKGASGLSGKLRTVLSKVHGDARPGAMFTMDQIGSQQALLEALRFQDDVFRQASTGGWQRITEKAAAEMGVDKKVVDGILKNYVKAGSGFGKTKVAYNEGKAAAAALGGARLRFSIPVLNLRAAGMRLPGIPRVMDFSVGRRFFAGISGQVRLMKMVGNAEATMEDMRIFWEGGYSKLKELRPNIAKKLGSGTRSAFYTASEGMGGLTAHFSPHAKQLRGGGLAAKFAGESRIQMKHMVTQTIDEVQTVRLGPVDAPTSVLTPGQVAERVGQGIKNAGDEKAAELGDSLNTLRNLVPESGTTAQKYWDDRIAAMTLDARKAGQEGSTEFKDLKSQAESMRDRAMAAEARVKELSGDDELGEIWKQVAGNRDQVLINAGLKPDSYNEAVLGVDDLQADDAARYSDGELFESDQVTGPGDIGVEQLSDNGQTGVPLRGVRSRPVGRLGDEGGPPGPPTHEGDNIPPEGGGGGGGPDGAPAPTKPKDTIDASRQTEGEEQATQDDFAAFMNDLADKQAREKFGPKPGSRENPLPAQPGKAEAERLGDAARGAEKFERPTTPEEVAAYMAKRKPGDPTFKVGDDGKITMHLSMGNRDWEAAGYAPGTNQRMADMGEAQAIDQATQDAVIAHLEAEAARSAVTPKVHPLQNIANTPEENLAIREGLGESFAAGTDTSYAYHWSPQERLEGIQKRGLNPAVPADADIAGGFPSAVYFGGTSKEAFDLLPVARGRDAVLMRVKRGAHIKPLGKAHGKEELISEGAIGPEDIEVLGADGKWVSLKDGAPPSLAERAQAAQEILDLRAAEVPEIFREAGAPPFEHTNTYFVTSEAGAAGTPKVFQAGDDLPPVPAGKKRLYRAGRPTDGTRKNTWWTDELDEAVRYGDEGRNRFDDQRTLMYMDVKDEHLPDMRYPNGSPDWRSDVADVPERPAPQKGVRGVPVGQREGIVQELRSQLGDEFGRAMGSQADEAGAAYRDVEEAIEKFGRGDSDADLDLIDAALGEDRVRAAMAMALDPEDASFILNHGHPDLLDLPPALPGKTRLFRGAPEEGGAWWTVDYEIAKSYAQGAGSEGKVFWRDVDTAILEDDLSRRSTAIRTVKDLTPDEMREAHQLGIKSPEDRMEWAAERRGMAEDGSAHSPVGREEFRLGGSDEGLGKEAPVNPPRMTDEEAVAASVEAGVALNPSTGMPINRMEQAQQLDDMISSVRAFVPQGDETIDVALAKLANQAEAGLVAMEDIEPFLDRLGILTPELKAHMAGASELLDAGDMRDLNSTQRFMTQLDEDLQKGVAQAHANSSLTPEEMDFIKRPKMVATGPRRTLNIDRRSVGTTDTPGTQASEVIDEIAEIQESIKPLLDDIEAGTAPHMDELSDEANAELRRIVSTVEGKDAQLADITTFLLKQRGYTDVRIRTDAGDELVTFYDEAADAVPLSRVNPRAPHLEDHGGSQLRAVTPAAREAIMGVKGQVNGRLIQKILRSVKNLPREQAEAKARAILGENHITLREGQSFFETDPLRIVEEASNESARRVATQFMGESLRHAENLGLTRGGYGAHAVGLGRYRVVLSETGVNLAEAVGDRIAQAAEVISRLSDETGLDALRKHAEKMTNDHLAAEAGLVELRDMDSSRMTMILQRIAAERADYLDGTAFDEEGNLIPHYTDDNIMRNMAERQANMNILLRQEADGSIQGVFKQIGDRAEDGSRIMMRQQEAKQVYYLLDADDKVLGFRSVTLPSRHIEGTELGRQFEFGTVVAMTAKEAQGKGHGLRLLQAHWGELGVYDGAPEEVYEKMARATAAQEFSTAGMKLNQKAVKAQSKVLLDAAKKKSQRTQKLAEIAERELQGASVEYQEAVNELNTLTARTKSGRAPTLAALVGIEDSNNLTGMATLRLPGFEEFRMPAFMAEEFEGAMKGFPKLEGPHLAFRKFNNWWKQYATWLVPGFHIRNLQGAFFNNWLGGVGLRDYITSSRIRFAERELAKGKPAKWAKALVRKTDPELMASLRYAEPSGYMNGVLLDDLTYSDLAQMTAGLNLTASNGRVFAEAQLSAEAQAVRASKAAKGKRGAISRIPDPYKKLMRGTGTMTENVFRTAAFVRGMREGRSVMESRAYTMMRHGDYEDLTDTEYMWVRDLIPFYKWMRTNTPFQIHQLLESPGKLLAVQKGQQAVYAAKGLDYEREKHRMPAWMGEGFTIPHSVKTGADGLKVFDTVMLDLPMSDLFMGGREFLSSFLPTVKPLLESYVFHQSTFSGAPLEGKKVAMNPIFSLPGLSNVLDATGFAEKGADGLMYTSDQTNNLLSAIPIYARFKQFINGDASAVKKRSNAVASAIFGLQLRPVDAEALADNELSFYYDQVLPTIESLKAQGYPLPTKDDLEATGVSIDNMLLSLGIAPGPVSSAA